MTTKRIDELTAATELTGDDLLPIMDGAATTKKILASVARDYFAAASQPLDSDLTAIAALTTTAYGRALLELANQAALHAALGSGAPSASTFLRGDGSWTTAGGGFPATRPPAGCYAQPGIVPYSFLTNLVESGNIVRYYPAMWNEDSVVTGVRIKVTSGFAATASRVGLCLADETWEPTSLVADLGTFDHTTSGEKTIVVSQPVTGATRYVWAWVANGQYRVNASFGLVPAGGFGHPAAQNAGLTASFTYGALPSPPTATTSRSNGLVYSPIYCTWTTA